MGGGWVVNIIVHALVADYFYFTNMQCAWVWSYWWFYGSRMGGQAGMLGEMTDRPHVRLSACMVGWIVVWA